MPKRKARKPKERPPVFGEGVHRAPDPDEPIEITCEINFRKIGAFRVAIDALVSLVASYENKAIDAEAAMARVTAILEKLGESEDEDQP